VERQEFERRLRSLDIDLFDQIVSQTTRRDRRSLLALHNACRDAHGTFGYLEIGSHLGGSLQVLIADDRCTDITSIDLRPQGQPDTRGGAFEYPRNSTERMLGRLRRVPLADLDKLRTIDASTDEVSPADVRRPVQLCLIDGEHTDAAALRDARFCRELIRDSGAIVFHDRELVRGGIREFLSELEPPFRAYELPLSLFVVELGAPRLVESEWVAPLRE
jgi:hypothetical protein